VKVLERAEPKERAAVYEELGIKLVYTPGSPDKTTPPQLQATAELARIAKRVGGATCNLAPHSVVMESGWSELRRSA